MEKSSLVAAYIRIYSPVLAFSKKEQQMQNPLLMPLSELRGVGPEHAALLLRLDLRTVGDALLHRPRRYEDRRHFQRVADLRLQEPALIRGRIVAAGLKRWCGGSRSVFEFILD